VLFSAECLYEAALIFFRFDLIAIQLSILIIVLVIRKWLYK